MDIPFRGRGRRTQEQIEQEKEFAKEMISLARSLDFRMFSRGWCYYLEPHGLSKSDFDRAEDLINSLREEGVLPIDLVAVSKQRIVEGLEHLSNYKTPADYFRFLKE